MKKLLMAFVTILMVASFSNQALAQSNADATATAELIIPLSITNGEDLDFGRLAGSATAGTAVLTASATPTVTPDAGVTVISGGTPTAAMFTVTGTEGETFTITLPVVECTLTGNNGGDITVDTWTCSEGDIGNVTLLTGDTKVFYVGGTLNVGADEVAGTYTGTFNIIVDYN